MCVRNFAAFCDVMLYNSVKATMRICCASVCGSSGEGHLVTTTTTTNAVSLQYHMNATDSLGVLSLRGQIQKMQTEKCRSKYNCTYFICFTMVLFPDSPAPVNREEETRWN